jgi:hypothetical protein
MTRLVSLLLKMCITAGQCVCDNPFQPHEYASPVPAQPLRYHQKKRQQGHNTCGRGQGKPVPTYHSIKIQTPENPFLPLRETQQEQLQRLLIRQQRIQTNGTKRRIKICHRSISPIQIASEMKRSAAGFMFNRKL